MKKILNHSYNDIICLDNLFLAWREFVADKKYKKDVQEFSCDLFDNILSLHEDLEQGVYRHGGYESFFVNDPKRRHIHKASVRDRLLHHAVYRILYPFFDRKFIADSYSCRLDKGTHKAINRFRQMANQVSNNHTRTCWVLKCDIRKFFASINHGILIGILKKNVGDENIIWLLENIIGSYKTGEQENMSFPRRRESHEKQDWIPAFAGMTDGENDGKVGLPLGNLTSQLFANVYMNEFDKWVKHRLKEKYYIRYADDFVFISEEKNYLELLIPVVGDFLQKRLKLFLHPDKLFIKTIASGVDFLGWVNFENYRILRKMTEKRMFQRIKACPVKETLQSYLGLLSHGNTNKIRARISIDYYDILV